MKPTTDRSTVRCALRSIEASALAVAEFRDFLRGYGARGRRQACIAWEETEHADMAESHATAMRREKRIETARMERRESRR